MSEIRTFKLRIKLQKAFFYGPSNNKYSSKQKLYITGRTVEPLISNNKIILKEGRRVSVNYFYDSLSDALRAIANSNSPLSFLIESNSDNLLEDTITDSEGNELVKFQTDSLCEA